MILHIIRKNIHDNWKAFIHNVVIRNGNGIGIGIGVGFHSTSHAEQQIIKWIFFIQLWLWMAENIFKSEKSAENKTDPCGVYFVLTRSNDRMKEEMAHHQVTLLSCNININRSFSHYNKNPSDLTIWFRAMWRWALTWRWQQQEKNSFLILRTELCLARSYRRIATQTM